jgi:hypothetical protein
MTRERASMFGGDDNGDKDAGLDVGGFKPRPAARPDAAEVRRVAEQAGFTAREPDAAPPRREQRRHRTGRDRQLNIKCSADYQRRFGELADRMLISQAEAFERAVDKLEEWVNGGDRIDGR